KKAGTYIWREWAKPMLVILIITSSMRSAVADRNDVPTGSMNPTILEGDRVFVNKLAYDLKVPFTTTHIAEWDNPQRGDIVVFFSPKDGIRLVKRVIGLPGDTIEMRSETLFINGVACVMTMDNGGNANSKIMVHESLGKVGHSAQLLPGVNALRTIPPILVPAGEYFMMGDNRDNSFDSRYFGTVKRQAIIGKATSVVASLDINNKYKPRWSRFFSSLTEKPATAHGE
ncbi:MAG: signal peptidase, partial [Verrucomicrobiales bacterium]|nr:signal peptidase [Verrucomicrobiales bacterium]